MIYCENVLNVALLLDLFSHFSFKAYHYHNNLPLHTCVVHDQRLFNFLLDKIFHQNSKGVMNV